MNEEFEEWWEEHRLAFSGNSTDNPHYRAAFLAGAAAMREKAAEVADSYYRESGMTEVIAGDIRKLDVT